MARFNGLRRDAVGEPPTRTTVDMVIGDTRAFVDYLECPSLTSRRLCWRSL